MPASLPPLFGRRLGGQRRSGGRHFGMEPVGAPEQVDIVVAQQVVHLIKRDIRIGANKIREDDYWQWR